MVRRRLARHAGGVLQRILRLPFSLTVLKDLAYLTLGQITGAIGFTLLFVGPLTGALLLITIVGIPILLASLWLTRQFCNLERRRGALAGVPIAVSRRTWGDGGWMVRLGRALSDAMTWRELAWLILAFGLTLGCFVAAVTVWAVALGLLAAPLWMWAIPDGVDFGLFTVDAVWEMFIVMIALGPLSVVVAAWFARGCTLVQALPARALLAGDEQERIQELTVSRAGAVDAAAAELRRIERDLHDGAQARLVALAMDIGMAREAIERDPEAAAALLERSHADAKTALQELRNLARGIHPAILADRGLDAAVSALAARCPVPCTVDIELPQRLPAAVESAAYFTVAEALTNVAKHSGAQRCWIDGYIADGRLVIEVGDDGRGGVDTALGTGITGLRGRVEALDGRLTVDSGAELGTTLRAELPCGS